MKKATRGDNMNYNPNNDPKICFVKYCDNQVTGWRLSRKHPACSGKCTKILEANKQTAARAKRYHKATTPCQGKKCSRIVIVNPEKEDLCRQCAKLSSNHNVGTPIGAGKSFNDHRAKICNNGGNGPLCSDYNDCTNPVDSGENQGKLAKIVMKYELNGGINCHIQRKDQVTRINYGDSMAVCVGG